MAKYTVSKFNLTKKTKPNTFDYIELKLELFNSSGNPKSITYTLHGDENYKLHNIESIIQNGLQVAIDNKIKIEISEYLERNYMTLTLPEFNNGKIVKKSHRYTAHKI